MRAVVQRVRDCSVKVDGVVRGSIDAGLLVYLGIGLNDGEREVAAICDKIIHLRILPDDQGRMNLSVLDTGAALMVVSQFTLYGDAREGRRPSYSAAAPPDTARPLYEMALSRLGETGLTVAAGVFQASMEVTYTNMGPVTILLDSEKTF
jgi:D-aminoacyl-tRNA deacylase